MFGSQAKTKRAPKEPRRYFMKKMTNVPMLLMTSVSVNLVNEAAEDPSVSFLAGKTF
jgi:hypothetical protein